MAKRHVSLLTKGPKFTPVTAPKANFESDIKDFTRRIKIKDVFWDKEANDGSIHRNKSNRPIFTDNYKVNNVCNLIEILQSEKTNCKDNLTEEERLTLKELSENEDVITKRADKSGNFVLVDKSFYHDQLVLEGLLATDSYQKISDNEDLLVMKNLKKLIKKHEDSLTTKEQDFITNLEWKTSKFYVLPKIHKSKEIINHIKSSDQDFVEMLPPKDLKSRPIIAGPMSPTQRLSEFLDTLLKPLVTTLKTCVKDDWDFIRKLPREFISPSSLHSYDVTSLYTSIPRELGLEALKFWINERRDLIPDRFSNEFILEAANFVLKNNNFLFDDVLYKQIKGTVMGTKFAPSYACLTVGFLEETKLFPIILPKYFNLETCKCIKDNYYRYMDDGFIALPNDLNPNLLKDTLNSLNDSIKFTMESGRKEGKDTESLNFLDIKIILANGIHISTDIYYKETNPHKYLNFYSAHPSHIKDSIP